VKPENNTEGRVFQNGIWRVFKNPEAKMPLSKTKNRWKDNVITDVKMQKGDVEWIHMATV
jgi:hypothetical protein